MSSVAHEERRLVVLNAARNLIHAAASRRSLLPPDAVERQFFLGVEAAANNVIHPELMESRSDTWLEHETASFREGYSRTSTLLTMATTSIHPPGRLALPEPYEA